MDVNSLWPSDATWQQRSGSTLAQVMACCLTAPSHYLHQCWLFISKVQWHSSLCNFTSDTYLSQQSLKITYLKSYSNLPGANELTYPSVNSCGNSTSWYSWHLPRKIAFKFVGVPLDALRDLTGLASEDELSTRTRKVQKVHPKTIVACKTGATTASDVARV